MIRRAGSLHKPLVRAARRRAREAEHEAFRREAEAIEHELAGLARRSGPIVVGPWLAEVGYEVLYWVPFLRWFADAHGVGPDRLIVLSRGGIEPLYAGLAATYVDIFDLMTPGELVAANARRRQADEGGGQKQTRAGSVDDELVAALARRLGLSDVAVCHPSHMFRMFQRVWYGERPVDYLLRRTRHVPVRLEVPAPEGLPARFIAAKFYGAAALPVSDRTRAAVRDIVARVAAETPVVLLETPLGLDEHRDFALEGLPNVTTLAGRMEPRTNLALQLAVLSRASGYLGTCGGLAWLAPFMDLPTAAVYEDDALVASHLYLARRAGQLAGAAPFMPLDLGAARAAGLFVPERLV